MGIRLEVVEGPHHGQVFEFQQHSNFMVGRSDRVHFRLSTKDKFFSRIHFMIEANPPLCRLTDMGSTNGTAVNGKRVASADLGDGDLITAGKTVLRVSLVAPEDVPVEVVDDSAATRMPSKTGHWPESEGAWDAGASREAGVCPSCSKPVASTSPGSGLLCGACRAAADARPAAIDDYRIVRELGRGGMGVVYLATRDEDGSMVALKTIKPSVAPTSEEVRRFLREARILADLDHPRIVAFRAMGEAAGLLYFAMEYIAGSDVAGLQKRRGGVLPVSLAVGLVSQMLQALDYAHAKGFVHRDIKPGNLLVSRDGRRISAKLSDFGLARAYQNSRMSGLTMKGDLGGTAAYMAPEQITDLDEAKPTVDQYSAGAMLYKLLTGHHVYDLPAKVAQAISMILLDDPVPILDRKPDLPKGLAAIVQRSIAREPSARFKDVREMRRALAEFAGRGPDRRP